MSSPEKYTAAVKSSSLEPTARALTSLGNLVAKDPKLTTILAAPTLSAKDKSDIIAELEKAAGANGATVKNFLATLAENNRLSLLRGVCDKFAELMSAAHGEVEMVVTSATVSQLIVGGTPRHGVNADASLQQLDNKTLSRLETAVSISSYAGQGRKLKVTN
jgi:F-type H+-transporting ATPase subunit O